MVNVRGPATRWRGMTNLAKPPSDPPTIWLPPSPAFFPTRKERASSNLTHWTRSSGYTRATAPTRQWSQELQIEFIKTARAAMVTAMYLVRNTGMRAGDIRKFPWARYNGEQVQIRSSKSGKLVWIPATRGLKAHLGGLTRTGALVMLTPTGKAYAKRYFNEHWPEDADAVKADDLNFHDNRGTAATLLAEAGATAPEIAEAMTWTVDKAQKMIDTYPQRRAGGARHPEA